MPRSSAEVKEIVQETENGFQDLRDKAQERQDQLYRHEAYRNRLVASIPREVTTIIAKMSDRPDDAAKQIQGILNTSLSFHVEGHDERKADKQELYYAWLWETQLNPGNTLLEAGHRHLTVSPFWVTRLDYEPFILPDDETEAAEYRRTYQPFSATNVDPRSVAALFDEKGNPTVSTQHSQMRLVDVARQFGEGGEDEDPFKILNEQFPFIRGDRGAAFDADNITGKRAKVWIIDDNSVISYYAEVDSHYYQVNNPTLGERERDIPNPWGRNSLFFAFGALNDDASDPVDRYKPLLDPLLGAQRDVDIVETYIASMAFTPSKYGQILPGELAEAMILEDKTVPSPKLGDGNIADLYGQIEELRIKNDANIWNFLEKVIADRDALLPPPFLTNPDISVVKDATATAQLQAYETSNRRFDAARTSKIKLVVDICKACDHFITKGGKHPRIGFDDESLTFKLSGKEKVGGIRAKSVAERKGDVIRITPNDFSADDTLEVTHTASTDSQKALAYQLVQAQVADGAAPRKALVAAHTEDVTGTMREIDEEKMFQVNVPIGNTLVLQRAIAMFREDTGIDLTPMVTELQGPPGTGGQGSPPRSTLRAASNQMTSPSTSIPAGSAAG